MLEREAVRPVQLFAAATGKNAADADLIIDAMDLMHTGVADAFALATSDSDFTSLAVRLRGAGAAVHGFGNASSPAPYRAACTTFVTLGVASGANAQLAALLADAIRAHAKSDGWANLSSVAGQLHMAGLRPADWGYSKLGKLLQGERSGRPGRPGKSGASAQGQRPTLASALLTVGLCAGVAATVSWSRWTWPRA